MFTTVLRGAHDPVRAASNILTVTRVLLATLSVSVGHVYITGWWVPPFVCTLIVGCALLYDQWEDGSTHRYEGLQDDVVTIFLDAPTALRYDCERRQQVPLRKLLRWSFTYEGGAALFLFTVTLQTVATWALLGLVYALQYLWQLSF